MLTPFVYTKHETSPLSPRAVPPARAQWRPRARGPHEPPGPSRRGTTRGHAALDPGSFWRRPLRGARLPGGEIVDAGLAALSRGEESVESLLVSLAAPRLKREGVPLPREVFADADVRLYRWLERDD